MALRHLRRLARQLRPPRAAAIIGGHLVPQLLHLRRQSVEPRVGRLGSLRHEPPRLRALRLELRHPLLQAAERQPHPAAGPAAAAAARRVVVATAATAAAAAAAAVLVVVAAELATERSLLALGPRLLLP